MTDYRENDLSGMTVNERLFHKGLLDQWTAAARARNRDLMLQLIREVEVIPPEPTVDSVL